MSSEHQISADEVALYDRQIRLWGMDAQNRMRNSKILLINLSAVASEVAKNIVLAGIGSLTILDSHKVRDTDLGANFFLRDEDVGKNRGAAGLDRVQQLNKRVKVTSVDTELKDLEAEWISGFDIVVATELEYKELVRVNKETRLGNKCFYAAGSIGLYGYVFADLIEHTFKIERPKPNVATKIGPETVTSTIVSSEIKRDGDNYTETIAKIEKYKPLDSAFGDSTKGFGSQFKARKLAKISPVLPGLVSLWDSERYSGSADKLQLIRHVAESMGLPSGIITEDFVTSFVNGLGAELAPVAAVLGGVLGQDILNVLAQKGQPIQNLFVFNGDSNEGPIYTL